MTLITPDIQKKLPTLYSQDGCGDNAIVYAKFFTPDSLWTWYATEASVIDSQGNYLPLDGQDLHEAQDVIFFGLVDGFEVELGYFGLRELESIRGPLGLQVERDIHFRPTSIKNVRDACRGRK